MWNILVQALLGAASGYLTNSWAIKKLFQKYPLIGGGLMLRQRQQMSAALAKVVEQDILNHHTLREQLTSPKVQSSLRALVQQFLAQLPQDFQQQCPAPLAQLPQFESLQLQLAAFIFAAINQEGPALLQSLLQQIKLEQLCSAQELQAISHAFNQWLNAELQQQGTLAQLLSAFLRDLQQQNLAQLFTPELLAPLDAVLQQLAREVPHFLQQQRDWVERWADWLAQRLPLEAALREVRTSLGQSTLLDYLGRESLQHCVAQLLAQALALLTQQPQLLAELLDALLEALEKSKLPLAALLPPDSQRHWQDFLQQHLPSLLERLFAWLQLQQEELERLVEESIDQSLDQSVNLLELLQNILIRQPMDNFTQRFNLVNIDEFRQTLQGQQSLAELSASVSSSLLTMLQEKPIGLMLTQLRRDAAGQVRPFLQGSTWAPQLLGWLQQSHCSQQLQNWLNCWLLARAQRPLASWLSDQNLQQLAQRGRELLRQSLPSYLCSPDFGRFLCSQSQRLSTQLQQQPLAGLTLPPSLLAQLTPAVFLPLKAAHLAQLQRKLLPAQLLPPLRHALLAYLHQAIDHYGRASMGQLLTSFTENPKTADLLTNMLQLQLDQKLEYLVSGRLAPLLSAGLDRLTEADLRAVLEKVFGKHLRPINLIGATLGGMVGAGMGLLPLSFYSIPPLIPLYGVIGWATNVIAINQLFAPKKFFGVIARNLAGFAGDVGRLIDEHLLDREHIGRMLAVHSPYIRQAITSFFQPALLLQNTITSEGLAAQLAQLARAPQLRSRLSQLGQLPLDALPLPPAAAGYQWLVKELDPLLDRAASKLYAWGTSVEPLRSALPRPLLQACQQGIALLPEKLCQYLAQLLEQGLPEPLAVGVESLYQSSLAQLQAWMQAPQTHQRLTGLLRSALQQEELQQKICRQLAHGLQKLLSDTSLEQLSGGKFLALLRQWLHALSPQLCQYLLRYLQERRDPLYQALLAGYRKRTNPWQKIGGKMLGVEKRLAQALDIFLSQKLPPFLQHKSKDVARTLDLFLLEKAQKIQLQQVFSPQLFQLEALAPLYRSALASPTMEHVLIQVLGQLSRGIPLRQGLSSLQLAHASQLFHTFSVPLSRARDQLGLQLRKQPLYPQLLRPIIEFIGQEHLLLQPCARFFLPYEAPQLRQLLRQLQQNFLQGEHSQRSSRQAIAALRDRLGQRKIGDFIAPETLEALLERAGLQLEQEKIFYPQLAKVVAKTLEQALVQLDTLLPPSLLLPAQQCLADSAVQQLLAQFPSLLAALDIQQVAQRTICQLPLAQIKRMFTSFAGGMLRSLKADGFLLGLPPVLLFTLLTLTPQQIWLHYARSAAKKNRAPR